MGSYVHSEGDYVVDATPAAQPDGKFVARALVSKPGQDLTVVQPDFAPFSTEAEAASAAHIAALAWIAHPDSQGR